VDGLVSSCVDGVCLSGCSSGFYSSGGDSVRTCSVVDGTYSGSVLTCSACIAPPPGDGVSRDCSSASACTYSCTSEFAVAVAGSTSEPRVCSSTDGTWSGVDVACSQCATPPTSDVHAHVSCTASACSVVCAPGYFRSSGASSTVCSLTDGSWQWSGTPLVCTACGAAPAGPDNSHSSCADGVCSYECDAGYHDAAEGMMGSWSSACSPVNGTWSSVSLACQPCTPPSTPVHATRACTEDGAVCSFECVPGFHRVGGAPSHECSPATGIWSDAAAVLSCEACVAPPAPLHGVMECNAATSACTASCIDGFYLSDGAATRECSVADGTWSGSPAACSACNPPLPGPNVTRVCTAAVCV